MQKPPLNESQRLIQLFLKRPALISPLCQFYPWTEELLQQFSQVNLLNWEDLSANKVMLWTENIIEKYSEQLDWWLLSCNEKLPFTEALIEKYQDKWVWAYFDAIKKSFSHKNKHTKTSLSANSNLPWSEALIARYEERWDWHTLSYCENLPWTEELIDRYQDRWSVIKGRTPTSSCYDQMKWHWEGLSKNKKIPWSESLIERHKDKWSWSVLSSNAHLRV